MGTDIYGKPFDPQAGAGTSPARAERETDEHKYARHTRNATVTIAWIVAVFAAATLVMSVIVVKTLADAANSGSSNITCIYNGTC